MKLSEITIENYCSCANVTIPISPFTPLIGYNNAGKSNILRSIVWLLKKSVLPATKFNDTAKPVIISGIILNVQIDALPANQQQQIEKYLHNGTLRFRRRQDSPGVKATDIKIEVFDPVNNNWIANPTGIDNAIGVLFPEPIFIEAMDDASVDVAQFAAKNTIGLLLKNTMEQIKANNALAHTALLDSLAAAATHLNGPNRISEFSIFETQASTALSDFFPGLNVHLTMQSPTIEDVIKTASIGLSEMQGIPRGFTSFGHGTQRSVQMALINFLANQIKPTVAGKTTTILLIDEPELYLHPHAIELLRESLQQISENSFQVILTTHSPLLIGERVLDTIVTLKDQNGHTNIRKKLADAASILKHKPHQASVIFSLQNASYLLFSEKVLIVEGKTEKMIFPDLYRTTKGFSISKSKTCLIEVCGSSSIAPTLQILNAVGFQGKAVVDLDYIFKQELNFEPTLTTNQDWIACKKWFTDNSTALSFNIGDDGFPTKKGSQLNVAAAFEEMAKAMPEEIKRLSEIMLENNFWVWNRGAIEAHLGIEKTDQERILFINTAKKNKSIDHAIDAKSITDCIHWI